MRVVTVMCVKRPKLKVASMRFGCQTRIDRDGTWEVWGEGIDDMQFREGLTALGAGACCYQEVSKYWKLHSDIYTKISPL